jgi:hypothetical protein
MESTEIQLLIDKNKIPLPDFIKDQRRCEEKKDARRNRLIVSASEEVKEDNLVEVGINASGSEEIEEEGEDGDTADALDLLLLQSSSILAIAQEILHTTSESRGRLNIGIDEDEMEAMDQRMIELRRTMEMLESRLAKLKLSAAEEEEGEVRYDRSRPGSVASSYVTADEGNPVEFFSTPVTPPLSLPPNSPSSALCQSRSTYSSLFPTRRLLDRRVSTPAPTSVTYETMIVPLPTATATTNSFHSFINDIDPRIFPSPPTPASTTPRRQSISMSEPIDSPDPVTAAATSPPATISGTYATTSSISSFTSNKTHRSPVAHLRSPSHLLIFASTTTKKSTVNLDEIIQAVVDDFTPSFGIIEVSSSTSAFDGSTQRRRSSQSAVEKLNSILTKQQ